MNCIYVENFVWFKDKHPHTLFIHTYQMGDEIRRAIEFMAPFTIQGRTCSKIFEPKKMEWTIEYTENGTPFEYFEYSNVHEDHYYCCFIIRGAVDIGEAIRRISFRFGDVLT